MSRSILTADSPGKSTHHALGSKAMEVRQTYFLVTPCQGSHCLPCA